MMIRFLYISFKISPIVPKKLCDPEPHNRTELWTQLKKRRLYRRRLLALELDLPAYIR